MNTEDLRLAASVKQRLLNLATERREDFNLVQVRYATERLLYRLSISPYADEFLLKGAMLFVLWENRPHRPTRDVDLLFLENYDSEQLTEVFRRVAHLGVPPDGLRFDADTVQAVEIREENAYGGIRIKMLGFIGNARIPIQIDVGLGDSVYPSPAWTEFATLLGFPAPRIRVYPVETVVAEKFQAIVELGNRNSRMKDFFDILYLQKRFEFSGMELQEAIKQTFRRRRTDLPTGLPDGLSESFSANPLKQKLWAAFLGKNRLSAETDLTRVCQQIAEFVLPVAQQEPFSKSWLLDRGWH